MGQSARTHEDFVKVKFLLSTVSFQQSGTMKRESSEGYISDKSSSNEAVDQVSSEANERAGRPDRF